MFTALITSENAIMTFSVTTDFFEGVQQVSRRGQELRSFKEYLSRVANQKRIKAETWRQLWRSEIINGPITLLGSRIRKLQG